MKYLLIDTNMYLKDKRLKKLLEAIDELKVPDINVGKSTPQLAIYEFRAFLNIGMYRHNTSKRTGMKRVS